MSTAHKTLQELALQLLSDAMGHPAEPGNAGLRSADAANPGTLDRALTALMSNEVGKAVGLLHFAVTLCAQPTLDDRAQVERMRLLSAAAGALALLEQGGYRGPDRRGADDRRTGEDRRDLGTEPALEVLEQRCGEDRRGGPDRRNPLRNALFKTGNDAWDASYKVAYEVVPLLHVCEFAARARYALTAFDFRAQYDKALMEKLDYIDPEWRTAIDDDRTGLRIAQCVGMARHMAENLADSLNELSERAHAAGEVKARANTRPEGSAQL